MQRLRRRLGVQSLLRAKAADRLSRRDSRSYELGGSLAPIPAGHGAFCTRTNWATRDARTDSAASTNDGTGPTGGGGLAPFCFDLSEPREQERRRPCWTGDGAEA
jgi:hypothetical protein